MRVTAEYQVTIPKHIREAIEIMPQSEVDFKEEDGKCYLVKIAHQTEAKSRFHSFRGIATVKMTTDQIMYLSRDHQ